ncbi:MAG TPA: tetratricopeptide repeat protein [Gemmataceae bacterium]|nr:tetratricopeptide repeat protein [Gemmataceae bacterium]
MPTVAELFDEAWRRHQANDFPRAQQLYQQVLQADPCHADAWCFLGAVRQAQGQLEEAEKNFQRALHLIPTYTVARNCLGVVLAEQGKLDAAVACLQELLRLDPSDPEAHNNLGLMFARQNRLDNAIASYERALQIRPDFAGARANLDDARRKKNAQGFGPAVASANYQSVPDRVRDANLRGIVAAQQGRLDEARGCFEQALQLMPTDADAYSNLGNIFDIQGNFDEAMDRYQQALRHNPAHVEAIYNLGVILAKKNRDDEAGDHYRQALRLKPDHVDAHYNLAIGLAKHGHFDEAKVHYDQALRYKPDYAEAHWNRAVLVLLQGDFVHGWPGYEWRWMQAGVKPRLFSQPLWDGSDLRGKTILLHAEQGFGDTIQFVRYAPLVKARGGRVIVECQPRLTRLLASAAGIDQLVPLGPPLPKFNVQAPLLSLPGIFQTTLATIPADVPYLQADAGLVEHWAKKLSSVQGFKVGIAWQGSPTFRDDGQRSLPLAKFERLAQIDGVRLISLQKGPGAEHLTTVADKFPVVDLGPDFDEAHGGFMDTAAVMKNLDLVISSDTAVPHLAGSLGVPVWIGMQYVPDWRWLLKREDSPWYPTMRLFRQTRYGQWDDVFERLAEALRRLR